MARLPRATYALMVSLLPATATVIGIVVLTQIPTPVEVAGVALVIGGVREPCISERNEHEVRHGLGNSGLKVSRLCLGMMSYGDRRTARTLARGTSTRRPPNRSCAAPPRGA